MTALLERAAEGDGRRSRMTKEFIQLHIPGLCSNHHGMTDSIDRLFVAVRAIGDGEQQLSRTAKLYRDGIPKMAKKVAEEAAEVAIEAVAGTREALIRESADLIYNLVVLWSAAGVLPQDVYAEMDRRERLYGIAQKLPKANQETASTVVSAAVAF